ncbi:hypothetical protein PIB30_054568 [Stylosanthes scabra]|uniref:RNase H type-1 domain-containing protein n=1 Tax=Stylosanthes scabra TaxID=79078 RepID=A0ABU6TIM0_9FABA|nr:hypothetical protein [Stylosanthes scabra]
MAWFVLTGGLNTRESLLRKGVIGQGEEKCSLCNQEAETNKIVEWEEAWRQINSLIKQWMVSKTKPAKIQEMTECRSILQKPLWWCCCYFDCNESKYIVGGYLSHEEGNIVRWLGEEVRRASMGEAYLMGLEVGLQFMLEEAHMENEEVKIVSVRKDLVEWIKGNEDTNWELRFLRNRTANMSRIFEGVEVIYKEEKEFKAKRQWEDMTKVKNGRWIRWEYSQHG